MFEITAGKSALRLNRPLMGASGAFGFAGEYSKLIDLSLLGALVTNPISLKPRRAANSTRVVPLDSGVLIHTGLPNGGIHKMHRQYAARWRTSPIPIVMHLIGSAEDLAECATFLDQQSEIASIELGINDTLTAREVRTVVATVRARTQLPLLAKLPLYQAVNVAAAAADGGADALVVAAPPRGTARDPLSGQLVGGRLYGTWLKPLAVRLVGQLAPRVGVPIIGCGGIHHPDDVRDFFEAGAKAVQLDSVVWVRPDMVAAIANALSGAELTRAAGALADEWRPYGETAERRTPLIVAPPPPFVPPPPEI
ncbi:MAG: dihydroorotate dehydrogenase [Anaerolineae bacterium]|nr:dihydroorotate dehydrogenase [Anaerolineae bacterium]MDW8298759.1 dihydroorotate dehydrogenase [Anaerolineae bacterium]